MVFRFNLTNSSGTYARRLAVYSRSHRNFGLPNFRIAAGPCRPGFARLGHHMVTLLPMARRVSRPAVLPGLPALPYGMDADRNWPRSRATPGEHEQHPGAVAAPMATSRARHDRLLIASRSWLARRAAVVAGAVAGDATSLAGPLQAVRVPTAAVGAAATVRRAVVADVRRRSVLRVAPVVHARTRAGADSALLANRAAHRRPGCKTRSVILARGAIDLIGEVPLQESQALPLVEHFAALPLQPHVAPTAQAPVPQAVPYSAPGVTQTPAQQKLDASAQLYPEAAAATETHAPLPPLHAVHVTVHSV